LWDCSWPNDQVSHQHLAPVPLSPVTFYLRSEFNNAEVSLLQGGLANFVLMMHWQHALHAWANALQVTLHLKQAHQCEQGA